MSTKWITEVVFLSLLVILAAPAALTLATARINSFEYAVIEEMAKLALAEELKDNKMAVMQPANAKSLVCSSSDPLAGLKWVIKGTNENVDDFLKSKIDVKFPIDKDCANGITLKEILRLANSMVSLSKRPFNLAGGGSFAYLPASSNIGCTTTGRFYVSGVRDCTQVGLTTPRNYKDSEMCMIKDCPKVAEYWSAWTPCYFCENSLLKWKKTQKNRVTMHIGKEYNVMDKSKSTNVYCLALMYLDGFDFKAWDWNAFVQEIKPTAECARALDLIKLCKEFQDQEKMMKILVDKINTLASTKPRKDLERECSK